MGGWGGRIRGTYRPLGPAPLVQVTHIVLASILHFNLAISVINYTLLQYSIGEPKDSEKTPIRTSPGYSWRRRRVLKPDRRLPGSSALPLDYPDATQVEKVVNPRPRSHPLDITVACGYHKVNKGDLGAYPLSPAVSSTTIFNIWTAKGIILSELRNSVIVGECAIFEVKKLWLRRLLNLGHSTKIWSIVSSLFRQYLHFLSVLILNLSK